MKVYTLLGEGAESSFARSFGVSFGINQATEWQDIAKEALKAVIIMAILERVFLSPHLSWLEGASLQRRGGGACSCSALLTPAFSLLRACGLSFHPGCAGEAPRDGPGGAREASFRIHAPLRLIRIER
jgi:hypothetical protein